MRRKYFFRQKRPVASASTVPNLISPTKSKNDGQQQQGPTNILHSTISAPPNNSAAGTGILRFHLDNNGKHKAHSQTFSSSSTARKIPTIFLLIERGDWIAVEERAKQYPHECNVWVSLVKKVLGNSGHSCSSSSSSSSSTCVSHDNKGSIPQSPATAISSAIERGRRNSLASLETSTSSVTTALACNRTSQCKALHHACKKLRSVHVQIQRLIQKHQSSIDEHTCTRMINNGYGKDASGEKVYNEAWRNGDGVDKDESYDDPWIQACRAILALIKAYPKAAEERETRHGCLPLHLAAFAMRRTKTSPLDVPDSPSTLPSPSSVRRSEGRQGSCNRNVISSVSSSPPPPSHHGKKSSPSMCSNSSTIDRFSFIDTCSSSSSCCFAAMLEQDEYKHEMNFPFQNSSLSRDQSQPQEQHMQSLQKSFSPAVISSNLNRKANIIRTDSVLSTKRPPTISTRASSIGSSLSSCSANFHNTNLNSPLLSHQARVVTPTKQSASNAEHFNNKFSAAPNTHLSSKYNPPFNLQRYLSNAPLRDYHSLLVIQALLSAYPPSTRIDSEGGRLPLHMALEGHATLSVLQTLVDAYPPAARRRTGAGFLPLHLAAERGVGDTGVAGLLLGSYPDGGIARNRFDRTPLEEALLAAGENGREFQTDFIRSVVGWVGERGGIMGGGSHDLLPEEGIEIVANGLGQGNNHSKSVTPNLQTITNLVQSRSWEDLIFLVETHPSIAKQKIHATTRAGIPSQTTLLYLVSEQNPTYDIIDILVNTYRHAVFHRNYPGGQTSLHAACTWGASEEVVGYLLAATGVSSEGGGGARQKDALGNLPLHAACYAGATYGVICSLLCTFPRAVEARNVGNLLPGDVVRRLWKGEKGRVVREMIEKTRMELEEERRMKTSDESKRDQWETRRGGERMNKMLCDRNEPRTPNEKTAKGKSSLSHILNKEMSEKLSDKKNGLMWV